MNVLHDAGFSDGHWEQLGQQLIEYGILATFRANRRGDSSLCMEILSVKLLVDTLKLVSMHGVKFSQTSMY